MKRVLIADGSYFVDDLERRIEGVHKAEMLRELDELLAGVL